MIGTLTTPLRGATLRFANDNRPPPATSAGKVTFRRCKPCTASIHVADADPAVDSTSKRRYSLYEVLRVKRDATSNEIKQAYRSLAKRYHPDSCDVEEHDDGKFIEIHDAYATLYDPVDRAMYDLELNLGLGRRSGVYTTVGKRKGVYVSRRWETDQCW